MFECSNVKQSISNVASKNSALLIWVPLNLSLQIFQFKSLNLSNLVFNYNWRALIKALNWSFVPSVLTSRLCWVERRRELSSFFEFQLEIFRDLNESSGSRDDKCRRLIEWTRRLLNRLLFEMIPMESLLFECLEFKSKRSSHFEWGTIIRFMKIPKLLQRHLFSEESSIVTSLLAICDLYYQWSQSYQLGNHRPLVIAHQLVAGIAIEWFAIFGLVKLASSPGTIIEVQLHLTNWPN